MKKGSSDKSISSKKCVGIATDESQWEQSSTENFGDGQDDVANEPFLRDVLTKRPELEAAQYAAESRRQSEKLPLPTPRPSRASSDFSTGSRHGANVARRRQPVANSITIESSTNREILKTVQGRATLPQADLQEAARTVHSGSSTTDPRRRTPQRQEPPGPGAYMGAPGELMRRTSSVDYSVLAAVASGSEATLDLEVGAQPPVESIPQEIDVDDVIVAIQSNAELSSAMLHRSAELVTSAHLSNDALVVANPVAEESPAELPKATQYDLEELDGARQKRQRKTSLFLIVGFLIAVGILLAVVFLVVLNANEKVTNMESNATQTTSLPTEAPSLSSEDEVLQLLPPDTQRAILNIPDSPQARAYSWVLDDPKLTNYSSWRVLQRFVLATLYWATSGDNWYHNDNWLLYNVSECDWFYHKGAFSLTGREYNWTPCLTDANAPTLSNGTNLDRVVQFVKLDANNLQGELPDELYLLTALQGIFLAGNPLIGGSLSPLIGNFEHLKALDMDSTGLQGSIPVELASLSGLTQVTLQFNQLQGPLHSELFALPELRILGLSQNLITGTIPTEIILASGLIFLHMDNLGLQGPIPCGDIEHLTNLRFLSLHTNHLEGQVCSEMGLLTSLAGLQLGDPGLTGWVPTELGLLSSLERLDIVNTQISGPLPSELGGLHSIKELLLQNNAFQGPFPSELGLLTTMVYGSMNGNQMSGTLPNEIGGLSAATTLYLWGNQFTGTVPTTIGNMVNMNDLQLARNLLSGELPTEIGNLNSTLQRLYIFDNQFSGALPTDFGRLSLLQDLQVNKNTMMSQPLPSELGLMISLKCFWADYNSFSGTIPSELGKLALMEVMYLSGNQFARMPSELGLMGSLRVLWLQQNNFVGSIHSELGLLPVQDLRLEENQLTGRLPTQLGLMTSLKRFSTERNQITGQIPSELGLIPLANLRLSSNRMTGSLPSELGLLDDSTQIRIFGNNFTGVLPAELCSKSCQGLTFPFEKVQYFLERDAGVNTDACTCTFGSGFPSPQATHEVVINVQYDDSPDKETLWAWERWVAANETHDGTWVESAISLSTVAEKGRWVSYPQRSLLPETLYRFFVTDVSEDGFSTGSQSSVSITNGTVPGPGFKGTILWELSPDMDTRMPGAFVWVDALGLTSIVNP
ncbi:LRR receptor-like serine threonine-protein kinase [Seminavis robusta]|uniref:LRR receptor-like serine threonine-protein kinase n=1 Tax=Seminavis robusta TaxID=568900 RepID=A0A9N8DQ09_9STRA|nr:LRR receptor-like serine threonine-protein kinase [Seminavis robusta]|eukprot:Sro273_g105050.1 LRR receptor-like serine threonine-protein kinase (1152) ;mRNA; r:12150-15773